LIQSTLTGAISGILSDTRVLICRPEPAASELASALASMGAECKILPTLAISPLEISPADRQKIMNLDRYQHVIVTSQHAAKLGLEHIDEYWPQFPAEQNWFAMGRKTAKHLDAADINLTSPDKDLSSETLLLQTKLKQVKSQKVLILKGVEGRDLLQQQLEKQGALVDTIELYQRRCPEYDTAHIQKSVQAYDPDYIIALSGETLLNLLSLSKQANISLASYSFILSSRRVANIALEQGIKSNIIPDNLMPIDIIRCIAKVKRTTHNDAG